MWPRYHLKLRGMIVLRRLDYCYRQPLVWAVMASLLVLNMAPTLSWAQLSGQPLQGSVIETDEYDQPYVNEDDVRELEQGTALNMTLATALNTATIQTGDEFFGKITRDYTVGGEVVIPRGTLLHGVCESAVDPKRMGRNASVSTRFDYLITPDGREIPIEGDYSNKDSTAKAALKAVARSTGYTAAGGVLGALLVWKYIGTAGVVASEGYALAGGAAVGGAVGLGMAVAGKGKHRLIPPGTEISVKLTEPIMLPTMTMPDISNEDYLPSGMTVKVLAMGVGKDPFGELTEMSLTLDMVNKTPNTFSMFDIALQDEYGSTFYASPFGDTGMWFQQLKPNSRWVGNISFSVDNPKAQHHLVFFKRHTREQIGKVALVNAMIADEKTAKRRLKEATAKVY